MTSKWAESQGSGLRRLHLSYDIKTSDASARELAFAIQPKWRETPGEIEIVKFTDGITNTLLKLTKADTNASQEQKDEEAILMRAYGNNTEILIDRDREAISHALLAARDLAPNLLARFDNGLLYRFIQGKVCTAKDLTREPVFRGVARKLAEWHARLPITAVQENGTMVNGVNGEVPSGISSRLPKPNIWTVMLKWVRALPATTAAECTRKTQLEAELEHSYAELDSTCSIGESGLVFGHCDLLSANVIMLPHSSKAVDVEPVAFIDYEYATPCPAAFDIANHFAEWVGYDCDYTQIPTRSVRRQFLIEYVNSYNVHLSPSQSKLDKSVVDELFDEIDRYRGMPGLYWGIWALIQATISQINFNYASYAEERLGEYFAWRAELDGSRAKQGGEMPLRERRWAEE